MSSENSTDNTAAPASAWDVRVLSGVHDGASVTLQPPAVLVIGSAPDCDVILNEAGVLPRHMLLLLASAERGELRAVDGEVRLLSQTLNCGAYQGFARIVMFALGNVCLAAGPQDDAGWASLDPATLVLPPAVPPPTQEAAAEPAPMALDEAPAAEPSSPVIDDVPPAARPARARYSAWGRKAAIGLCLVAGTAAIAAAWQEVASRTYTRQASSAVTEVLADLGAAEVKFIEPGNGSLRLEGVVRTEQQRLALMQALKERGLHVSVDVVSGEQLAMNVHSGFRQRGMAVDARYVGKGRVQVKGVAATPAVEQVISEVMASAKAITQIELTDPPASAPQAKATAAPAQNDSAALSDAAARDPKRVVGVIGGDEPYVLTQDGKHYLVGATLPDGSQIEKIVGHKVIFKRNGKALPVHF
jgi:type III secretion system YscD/HrpQ family protein